MGWCVHRHNEPRRLYMPVADGGCKNMEVSVTANRWRARAWHADREQMIPNWGPIGDDLMWGVDDDGTPTLLEHGMVDKIVGGEHDQVGEWQVYECPMMQSTGLLDNEGAEIFEGDVFGNIWPLRCVVERKETGAFELVFLDDHMIPWSIADGRVRASKILGNIHANPELLEPAS